MAKYAGTQKIRKKQLLQQNVLEAALSRMHYLFKSFDKIVVSFSGGKDSTVLLNLAHQVAKETGKLPLEVVFFDEEVISQQTHDYCARLQSNPDFYFRWICVPLKQRNACSFENPYWYCWDEQCKELWTRPKPQGCETQIPAYRMDSAETGVADAMESLYTAKDGKVCTLTGIRTEESLRRYRAVCRMKNDAYINSAGKGNDKNIFSAHPIYDWKSTDIWLAIRRFGWDYNASYDIFNLTNLNGKYLRQRVCPPFGEEPLRTLNLYQECFPEMFARMIKRVPGVGSAIRYANENLYGNNLKDKPQAMSWKEYLIVVLQNYNSEQTESITTHCNNAITLHYKKSILPLSDDTPDPISGLCWKALCKAALRGDFKSRMLEALDKDAHRSALAKGKSFPQVVDTYGTEQFKTTFYNKNPELRP
jgi:predicted phosphoadenosine phosphosulfate sulfurtransferase